MTAADKEPEAEPGPRENAVADSIGEMVATGDAAAQAANDEPGAATAVALTTLIGVLGHIPIQVAALVDDATTIAGAGASSAESLCSIADTLKRLADSICPVLDEMYEQNFVREHVTGMGKIGGG